MNNFIKIFGIYVACGLLIPLLFVLITGTQISEVFKFTVFQYSQMFSEIIQQIDGVSVQFGVYVGIAIRLCISAGFASIGLKRFKVGLVLELILSALNLGVDIIFTITSFR